MSTLTKVKKKASDLLGRVRRWLIRKLGGIPADQVSPPLAVTVQRREVYPVCTEAEVEQEGLYCYGERYKEMLLDRMACNMARAALKEGLVEIQRREDKERRIETWRMTLLIAK